MPWHTLTHRHEEEEVEEYTMRLQCRWCDTIFLSWALMLSVIQLQSGRNYGTQLLGWKLSLSTKQIYRYY